jgi:hypothetical protein
MSDPEPASPFDVIEIFDDQEAIEEQMGTKEKFWFRDLADKRWLFKACREKDGVVRGEDWAEVLVAEMAHAIGLPTARVRLALYRGRRGIISREVLDPDGGDRLVHGNSLLSRADPSYVLGTRRENPGYTVTAVRSALDEVAPPPGDLADNGLSGFDVWAGYLMLDAWVAGRDRHHENWAIVSRGTSRHLAPSFDHGNALGFQEHSRRHQHLADERHVLETWAGKGNSHHFAGKPSLVALAAEALGHASPVARSLWLDRLGMVRTIDIESTLDQVPSDIMSEASRRFVSALLDVNRRRIADECHPSGRAAPRTLV